MTVQHDHDHHGHAHDLDDDGLPPEVRHSEIHPPDYEVVSMIAARGCRHCGMIVSGSRLFEHNEYHDRLDRLEAALVALDSPKVAVEDEVPTKGKGKGKKGGAK
jgi:hypothetical protein